MFRCPDCHKRANFVKDLLQHMQESGHIEKKPMVVCPQCKSSFHTEQIGGHYEECVVKTIKGKRAESKSRLGKEKKQGRHPYFTVADFRTTFVVVQSW